MINVLFNDFSYEVLPKRKEIYDKYCKILQWGRKNPTRFMEDFLGLSLTDHQKYILLSSWVPKTVVWLCSRSSGKSFMSSPFIMTRSLLFPSHFSYIMAPSGGQAQETFTKLENLAKGNIASVLGTSTVFLDECVRANGNDAFSHNKTGYAVTLYNGSKIETLNGVAENSVGIRSNFNVFDEAGKIDRNFFALTLPFTVQDTNFIMGGNINADVYPKQMQNKNLFLSSAEGIDSELFDQYKLCFEKMLLGDPDYFVCDINCELSLHPFLNGNPTKPLVSQQTIDDAFKINPYKASREYLNRFETDGGEDNYVKRSTINKFSMSYYPVFENEGNGRKYIISYDPSTKRDNSVVTVAELFRDEVKGWMVRFVNCRNLIEVLPSGEKAIIQTPEQIDILKDMIVDYNGKANDYDNLDKVIIDAGAGGGGVGISQFLMNDWKGKDGRLHKGFIDKADKYMAMRIDDYPANSEKLTMFNFKRDKESAYNKAQEAINQGLVIFPNSLNARNEMEFEELNAAGETVVRYEKVSLEEMNALIQFDFAKEELTSMTKTKRANGTEVFELSHEAQSRNMHDDRCDTIVMILNRLMEIRSSEVLDKAVEESKFKDMFNKAGIGARKSAGRSLVSGPNPFANLGNSPFGRR